MLNETGKLGNKLNAKLLILGDYYLSGIDWENDCTKACTSEVIFDLVLVKITQVEVLDPIGGSDHDCVHIESTN